MRFGRRLGGSMVPALVLLGGLLVSPPRAAGQRAPKLDRKTEKALTELGEEWAKARPPTAFDAWDVPTRLALLEKGRALNVDPVLYPQAVSVFWQGWTDGLPRLKDTAIETPYGTATWLERGKVKKWDPLDPKSKPQKLVIGLHGGGEGAGSASEALGSWRVDGAYGLYPQGIELVHDTWNTVHGERFVLSLIELAKLRYDVDPDQVYVMGFSMGGTGSMFLAGRHPDLFAGAIPAHGVMMAAPQAQLQTKEEVRSMQHGVLPNLRNLPVYFSTGGVDQNCRPGTFLYAADRLAELREKDPGGYELVKFVFRPELAHAFAKGEPELAYEHVLPHTRTRDPKKLVWEYTADPFPMVQDPKTEPTTRVQKERYYYLRCSRPLDQMWIECVHEGNRFDLKLRGVDQSTISLELGPEMIDVTKPVEVWVGGQKVYEGTPEPDFGVVLETLDARADRRMWFDRRIELH